MNIRIKLMGMLKDKAPTNGLLQVADGKTIREVLADLEIADTSVQAVTVNGSIQRDHTRVLAEGDELMVLPPVGGGC